MNIKEIGIQMYNWRQAAFKLLRIKTIKFTITYTYYSMLLRKPLKKDQKYIFISSYTNLQHCYH